MRGFCEEAITLFTDFLFVWEDSACDEWIDGKLLGDDDSAPADGMEISARRADYSEAREWEITEKEEGRRLLMQW